MPHTPSKAFLPPALIPRIKKIPSVEKYGVTVIENFGMFIDTHRDQPHIGTFAEDIHRGACLPTPVDYLVEDDLLRHQVNGMMLQRHDKHLFITNEEWSAFMLDYLMNNGVDPRDAEGTLPTSHFRDARKKIYLLKSFRQMVMVHFFTASARGGS